MNSWFERLWELGLLPLTTVVAHAIAPNSLLYRLPVGVAFIGVLASSRMREWPAAFASQLLLAVFILLARRQAKKKGPGDLPGGTNPSG